MVEERTFLSVHGPSIFSESLSPTLSALSLPLSLSLSESRPQLTLSPKSTTPLATKQTHADRPMWSRSTRPPRRLPTVSKCFSLFSPSSEQSAKPSGKNKHSPFSFPSFEPLPINQPTAALKAVIAECKVGAKLVDIADKGDALIEE